MDRARLGDTELEYQVHGSGEPVVFIHPGIYADWFTPLLGQPILTTRYIASCTITAPDVRAAAVSLGQ